MHYLIYKTTCLVNGKYYVGKHKTQNRDDNYLGSGKLLQCAIKKYGRENFIREIILECSTEDEMNLAERILVVPDVEVNYNLCPGGQGGFGYINENTDFLLRNRTINLKKDYKNQGRKIATLFQENETYREQIIENLKKCRRIVVEKYPNGTFKNKKHSKETIEKIKISVAGKSSGMLNSQFGRPRSEETKQKIRESLARTRNKMN